MYCKAPGRTAVARWNPAGSSWVVRCEACDAIGPGAGFNAGAHWAFENSAVGRHAEVLVKLEHTK